MLLKYGNIEKELSSHWEDKEMRDRMHHHHTGRWYAPGAEKFKILSIPEVTLELDAVLVEWAYALPHVNEEDKQALKTKILSEVFDGRAGTEYINTHFE